LEILCFFVCPYSDGVTMLGWYVCDKVFYVALSAAPGALGDDIEDVHKKR